MTKKLLCSIALLVLGLTSLSFGQAVANPNFPLNANGKIMASEFGKWAFQSLTTITSGAQTVTLNGCYIKVGTAATQFYPIVPSQSLLINDGSNTETVTVTSVTQPVQTPGVSTVNPYSCTFTATFANAHQAGFNISSNDGGVYEAASYAQSKGFGTVLVDSTANMTVAQIAALTPLNVTLEDVTGPQTEYFNVQPTTLTAVTVPIPRVGTAATGCTGSNTVCDGTAVGTWTNAAVYFCVTYVDLLGAESPCSTTAHYTTAGSVALNFLAPAAMTGAVGWRAYAGASYATAYQLPITSANCTLTTLETVQPACAVTNASYGQVGSNGVFPTPTVHTQIPPQTGGVAAAYNPNTQSHTTFAWIPSLTPGPGFQTNYGPFAKLAALTGGQSVVLATVPIPLAELNYIGRTVRYTGTVSLTYATTIDPVVMAASVVMRLQTVVSREVAATDAAVLTVGVLQAGTKENVIPDDAVIKLNVRTFDAGVRKHVLAAIERIVNAEAEASGAPRKPEITPLDRYPLNVNDETASNRIAEAFRAYFPADRVKHTGPAPASEDFGCFGTAWHVPSVFWFVGGNDPKIYATAKAAGKLNELPVNHSPQFAPVLHPTMETGVEALVVGALAWLGET